MITGAHVIVYSRDADADRAFFRDVLEYPHVDAGGGWRIFKLPPGGGDLGLYEPRRPKATEL
jgi:catechol 2,3-dioxygenase-like lactoylglutathione lyase family enzyme